MLTLQKKFREYFDFRGSNVTLDENFVNCLSSKAPVKNLRLDWFPRF